MKNFFVSLILSFAIFTGCAPPPTPPGVTLSPEYQGGILVDGRPSEGLILAFEQVGNQIKGDYLFNPMTGAENFFGKLEGKAENGLVKVDLKIPAHYVREWNMTPVIKLSFESKAASESEAKDLLKGIYSETKVEGKQDIQMLVGTAQFNYFQDTRESEFRAVNLSTGLNVFNK